MIRWLTKLTPMIAFFWWATFAFAQQIGDTVGGATHATDINWTSLVGSGGALTMLGWYLYYNTAIAGPRRDDAQQKHVEAIVSSVNGLTESFREESRELRQWHTDQVAETRAMKRETR